MDTFVSIRVFYRNQAREEISRALDQAAQRMVRIDSLCDHYRRNSEVSRINSQAGTGWVPVSPEVRDILRESLQMGELSQGRFDVSIGLLMDRYGFGRQEMINILSPDEIARILKKVNYKNIRLQGDSVSLLQKGMLLDLGGVAKGYAVDEAMRVLSGLGMTDAQVDAGGNLATRASPMTAGKRHIYIRHPQAREKFYGRFRMDNGCVATSGDYERYYMYNNKRYHHILDPKTGLPAWGCRSVTIQAPSAMLSDILSTTIFILGPEQGMALVESLPDVEAIVLYEDDNGLHHKSSSGLVQNFELLESVE
jgi:FAD:protein FMN transferase